MKLRLLPLGVALLIPCTARAQSLNERAPTPTGLPERGPDGASAAVPPAGNSALNGVSLFLVTPPAPRTYQKNDLVEIIINESSKQTSEQSLDTKKEYEIAAELTRFPSLRHLLEAQLRDGDTTPIVGVEARSDNEFKGEGDYERKDRFTARIAAVVIEVKPNGTLLLEARKQVNTNKEETTLVLSGLARPEDITVQNTIQSSQIANLSLTVKNEGDVKKSASKGLIPQLLDTIFNF